MPPGVSSEPVIRPLVELGNPAASEREDDLFERATASNVSVHL
jgi:hypothetical protein